MQEYVVGFLFDFHGRVLLINKTKPEWQKGKLNGVGGKVEIGEDPSDAMIREFEEEAGITVNGWRHFATMNGKDYNIYFYTAFHFEVVGQPKSMTEEKVEWVDVNNLPTDRIVPNTQWLIPVARHMKADYHARFTNNILTAAEGQK